MAIQTINIGNLVNDGLGDDLRTAFQKVNANFTELADSLTITAANVPGTNGVGLFKEQIGLELRFKTLKAGNKIAIQELTDVVEIRSTQEDSFIQIDTDLGQVRASDSQYLTFQGGTNVAVTSSGQVITFDTKTNFDLLLTNFDFGPLSQSFSNVIQASLYAANIDFGTIGNPAEIAINQGTL